MNFIAEISASEAKNKLGSVLDRVDRGEDRFRPRR